MTPRRAWALLLLAAAALGLTPLAAAAAGVAVAALAALATLAGLQARDTLREERVATLEARFTALAASTEADRSRTAAMWREYTAHGGT